MIKYYKTLIYSVFSILFITACHSWFITETHSYGDECKHCHGENLQGINNIKSYCGQCHDHLFMKPDEISSIEIKNAVFSGPHPHKTDNIFKSTPSCFYCHRRSDF